MWRPIQQALSSRFETPHGSRQQIPPIEGLRGLATLLVFSVHYVTLVKPWLAPNTATEPIATALYAIGHAGVDLFFVLSGFLIYGGLMARPAPFTSYVRRRLRRIYPAFAAVFLLYVAATWFAPSQSKLPDGAANAGVYLAANFLLLPGMVEMEPMITVAWSLSFEMFFYLTCPVLIECLFLRRWPAWGRCALFVALAGVLLLLAPVLESRTRLAMFLAGMLLVETLRPLPGRLLSAIATVAVGAALACSYEIETRELGPAAWTAVLFIAFYLLSLAAFQDDGPLWRVFSWTPLRWFGNMSYSFFLLHGLVLNVLFFSLRRIAPPAATWDGMFWILLVPAFILALLSSAVLFLLVERPFSLALPREGGKRMVQRT
jgi:peptidoglycan/LPS O-acetylase OafA/YrhL